MGLARSVAFLVLTLRARLRRCLRSTAAAGIESIHSGGYSRPPGAERPGPAAGSDPRLPEGSCAARRVQGAPEGAQGPSALRPRPARARPPAERRSRRPDAWGRRPPRPAPGPAPHTGNARSDRPNARTGDPGRSPPAAGGKRLPPHAAPVLPSPQDPHCAPGSPTTLVFPCPGHLSPDVESRTPPEPSDADVDT